MGLTQILSAFGLSASAGLNAYIPLLLIALLARFTGWVTLSPPFDVLTNEWVIGVLAVLLLVETFADKIPGVDHVNDFIQTFIRPAAGAFLFASEANVLRDVNPILPLVAGLIVAGTVHVTKATARPVINLTTLGIGAPIVSTLEDILAIVTTLAAVFVPIAIIFFLDTRRFVLFDDALQIFGATGHRDQTKLRMLPHHLTIEVKTGGGILPECALRNQAQKVVCASLVNRPVIKIGALRQINFRFADVQKAQRIARSDLTRFIRGHHIIWQFANARGQICFWSQRSECSDRRHDLSLPQKRAKDTKALEVAQVGRALRCAPRSDDTEHLDPQARSGVRALPKRCA